MSEHYPGLETPTELPMPSMEEMRVGNGVHLLLSQIDDLIELRHRADTADLMMLEEESLHLASAKLSNLVADIWHANHKRAAE